jgi:DNA replication protein DnaC
MADATIEALKAQLRLLRLPTMGREFDKLARDAAAGNQTFAQFLLRLTELELATRAANAITSRIKDAGFPVEKDFDTYDFTLMPQLSKPKILELARCEWITQNRTAASWGATELARLISRSDWDSLPVARECVCASSRRPSW